MIVVVPGSRPPPDEPAKQEYLRKKLAEVRKNCQFLAGLGVAEAFGALIKDPIGAARPTWRLAVFAISGAQILLAVIGAFSWSKIEVDNAQVLSALDRRLRLRHWLRNATALLFILSLSLIAALASIGPSPGSGTKELLSMKRIEPRTRRAARFTFLIT